MRKFIAFLIKRHIVVLFLLLQSAALLLSARQNAYQEAEYFSSANYLIGSYYNFLHNTVTFVKLSSVNDSLSEENARLKTSLYSFQRTDSSSKNTVSDTLNKQQYTFTWAKVVNSTTHLTANYLTLNKGSLQGIKPRSAVITPQGIVGIVNQVSPHFATVISVLNPKFRLSCMIEPVHYAGVLFWEGGNHREAILNDVPRHVPIKKGMKILTSPYSNIFPSGIPVGFISNYELPAGSNTYRITVQLNADMRNLDYIYVVDDLFKDERENLEKNMTEDEE